MTIAKLSPLAQVASLLAITGFPTETPPRHCGESPCTFCGSPASRRLHKVRTVATRNGAAIKRPVCPDCDGKYPVNSGNSAVELAATSALSEHDWLDRLHVAARKRGLL